jgi:hypothetical protein
MIFTDSSGHNHKISASQSLNIAHIKFDSNEDAVSIGSVRTISENTLPTEKTYEEGDVLVFRLPSITPQSGYIYAFTMLPDKKFSVTWVKNLPSAEVNAFDPRPLMTKIYMNLNMRTGISFSTLTFSVHASMTVLAFLVGAFLYRRFLAEDIPDDDLDDPIDSDSPKDKKLPLPKKKKIIRRHRVNTGKPEGEPSSPHNSEAGSQPPLQENDMAHTVEEERMDKAKENQQGNDAVDPEEESEMDEENRETEDLFGKLTKSKHKQQDPHSNSSYCPKDGYKKSATANQEKRKKDQRQSDDPDTDQNADHSADHTADFFNLTSVHYAMRNGKSGQRGRGRSETTDGVATPPLPLHTTILTTAVFTILGLLIF